MSSGVTLKNDRCFQNPYPDELGDDHSQVLNPQQTALSSQFRQGVEGSLKVLLGTWEAGLGRGDQDPKDTSVYTGTAGHALLYLRLHHHYHDLNHLKRAWDVLKGAVRGVKGRRVSFVTGDPGPLALAALVAKMKGKMDKCRGYVDQILALRTKVLSLEKCQEDEVLYGRAGYLYALLFLRHHQVEVDRVTVEVVAEVVDVMITSGRTAANREGTATPLMYYWHNKAYIGAAHGLVGILFMLLQTQQQVGVGEAGGTLRRMVDYVCGLQLPSGNLPSSLPNDVDRLVHWCHGASGAIFLFLKAYQVYGDEKYLNHARQAGQCVWERGLLHKGYGLCHGVAGNGYALLYLYQMTGEAKYLYRAGQFGRWCQDYGTHQSRTPDRPLSLFEGLAGTICFLLDLLNPNEAKFPAFVV